MSDRNSRRNGKSKKVHVVFQEHDRREFLTGFHKRKVARRKKAQQDFENMLKESKKKMKTQIREMYQELAHVHNSQIENSLYAAEYELPEHIVYVNELSPDEIADSNNWIGRNKIEYKAESSNCDIEFAPFTSNVITSKGIKKCVQKESANIMRNDKAFQLKNKMDRLKNRKKAKILKRNNRAVGKGKRNGKGKGRIRK